MSEVIDLTAALRARAVGQARNDVEDFAREQLQSLFRILANAHGLSEEWAAEKAAIAHEIVATLVRPVEWKLRITTVDLTDAQHAAVTAATEAAALDFHARVVTQCLDALASRLIKLALP